MRISQDPRLPVPSDPSFRVQLIQILREFAKQLNPLTEGRITAVTNATTAAPTAGAYQQGDKVWNSAPVEAGAGGSKYVTIGFICTAAGSPGTWLPMRVLTGN